MSYLGWLKITASRPGAARKATTRGAAGCAGRVWCTPCPSSGPRRQGQGHSAEVFTVGSRAGRAGSEAAVFLGFRGEDRGGSWGQRARRAGPGTNVQAWMWGQGSVQMLKEGPATPFPYAPARRCRWRTLPRQSAVSAGAAVAMSLNLNGSSSSFPILRGQQALL